MKRVLSGIAECAVGCADTFAEDAVMHLANSAEVSLRDGGCGPLPALTAAGGGGGGITSTSAVTSAAGCATNVDGASTGEQCRFPKLEECAHFHYERVQLPPLSVCLKTNVMERSLHSQHSHEHDDCDWYMVQVQSGEECWLLQRTYENFRLLDSQLHQCIYDRKISQLPDLSAPLLPTARRKADSAAADECIAIDPEAATTLIETILVKYLRRFTAIANNSINCGPVLNWLQMDNRGHRLLVPSEESRSINTPAVAAAYSVRRYVSQARDELNLEVGDMISVIDMASPGESIWWRGKRGFQVGFFPQHCVHIIGDKVPRNMPLPAPVVGSLALSPIKPVLRKHGKLIAFFRSFILNRPSRRRLKQSGILRERVFGCDLGEHLLNSGCEIPTVLKCCAEFLETHGIVDGIYRLSGVTSNIQKLRNAFDEDRIPNLYTEDILQDIHSVASLLKMYFRELPNPLCTYQLYQSFVQAVQGCTSTRNTKQDHERLLKMREAVQKLPPPHYRTLEYLTRHLAKVAKHGERTGMTVRNVAIVWAPNLLRCAELEVGGVAALQGVGVQAVVTEFLICYADLIFCDNLNLKLNITDLDSAFLQASSPKRSRPKSLAISTPTKLITLEEARSKHHKEAYIEVGGGPDSLPKKYHTIIELPLRKRVNSKRSPLGWRSLFGKSRNSTRAKPTIVHHHNIMNNDEADSTTNSNSTNKNDVKIVLRTVKSAESLSDLDQLPPLQNILSTKPPGHNRSVSHDSYFDTLQSNEGSLLDLSEIQVNFDLEESEMRIFSEDESLVSSPRVQPRRIRISSGNNSSGNPSPKKQPRVVLSPESASRKRTRLEEQLSDIQFIDCNTPEMIGGCSGSTIVQVHHQVTEGPRNKSPRNSQCFELCNNDYRSQRSTSIVVDPHRLSSSSQIVTPITPSSPTPQSPTYKLLPDSSTGTTPGDLSPSFSALISPQNSPKTPTYENVLTTISITYKSPTKTAETAAALHSPNYEVVAKIAEDAQVPTSTANLPVQEAKTDLIMASNSLGDIDEMNLISSMTTSTTATVSTKSPGDEVNEDDDSFPKCDTTLSELIDSYDRIAKATSGDWSQAGEADEVTSNSEDVKGVEVDYENITFSSEPQLLSAGVPDLIEFSPVGEVPDVVSHDLTHDVSDDVSHDTSHISHEKTSSSQNIGLGLPQDQNLSQLQTPNQPQSLNLNQEKRKQDGQHTDSDDLDVYQQVKYFRRSVHEINELLALSHDLAEDQTLSLETDDVNSTELAGLKSADEAIRYENIDVARVIEIIEPEPAPEQEVQMINVNDKTNIDECDKTATGGESSELTYDSLETTTTTTAPSNFLEHDYDYEPIEFANDSLEFQTAKAFGDDPSIMVNSDVNTDVSSDVAMTPTTNESEAGDNDGLAVTMTTEDVPVRPSEAVPMVTSSGAELVITSSTNVKNLTSKFEQVASIPPQPPCIRARNLRSSLKPTRSLDESEFLKRTAPKVTSSGGSTPSKKSLAGLGSGSTVSLNAVGGVDGVDVSNLQRRQSLDETNLCVANAGGGGYKMNTLPKTLNKPKQLPDDPDMQLHVVPHDVHLSRERIEKYKEERRKYLHDKYRSESFKENKDVLLSRFKVFKGGVGAHGQKEEHTHALEEQQQVQREREADLMTATTTTGTALMGGSRNDNMDKILTANSGATNGVKARTALFEPEVDHASLRHPGRSRVGADITSASANNSFEAARRSFENTPISRKDSSRTSYCIKDMKAIFESKSQQ